MAEGRGAGDDAKDLTQGGVQALKGAAEIESGNVVKGAIDAAQGVNQAKGPALKIVGTCCAVELIGAIFVGLLFINVISGGGTTDTAEATTTGTGSMSNVSEVPDSLKPIFEAAAKKHNISPAFLAAIFWKEHGRSFPTSGPWATSNAGANGPFQFIAGTWNGWKYRESPFETNPSTIAAHGGYGQDGDSDNIADVQNLWDSAFAAADLLGSNGAAPNVTDLEVLKDVASRYNSGKPWAKGQNIPETANYVPDVISEYQLLLSQM